MAFGADAGQLPFFAGTLIRDEHLIVDGDKIAGAHSYAVSG
ncbi:hypothetical protein C8D88_104265 [Lentzea atacamensis]|uniref:Uncharacterized protein n=1 Tax=Lentzea atacamensis TaxID=531938 RepID=A0A316I381_9PSEU|nr:hypothetical protein [Lentzea atacamensis]PWK87104.1 hypothetical protein C8D88_104265 [Lentzea atacamensis]